MSDLRIVKGNAFSTIILVKAYAYYSGKEVEDFDLLNCTNIVVVAKVNGNSKIINDFRILEDNKMLIFWETSILQVGSYSLEVTGSFNGIEWRFYDSTPLFDIVYTNEEARVPKHCIISEDTYWIRIQELYMSAAKGDKGDPGEDGKDGKDGKDGTDGKDGITPHIDPITGNWFIGDVDTNVHALGPEGTLGEDGGDGEDGNTPIMVYRWTTSGSVVPSINGNIYPPSGWSKTAQNRPGEGYYLWMSSSIKHSDGTIDNWSIPVRISGDKGDAGEDGADIEYIYILKTSQYVFPTNEMPANIVQGEISPGSHAAGNSDVYDNTVDDWVPENWWDNPQGVDSTYKYEYMSWRKKGVGSNEWGAFSNPVVWSHWGENGMDGDGVQYVYKLFATELSDADRESNIPTKPSELTQGEWIPANWSDDPLAPTELMPYCYCSVIKCINGVWGNFEKLGLWSKYSKDGAGQPDYIQTQEAWSSVESVATITTMPSDCTESSWSDTTPANPNNKPYLWRRSRKMVLLSDGTYDVASGLDGSWKYTRLSGTNGTSIDVKDSVSTVADLANISNPLDGDAYVVNADGHLYMWSGEANNWIDIGQFKGDSGTTYYTHVAWGSGVTIGTPPSHTPSQGQTSIPNASAVTTFDISPFTGATHMGILVDTVSQDSVEKFCYTWQEVKGEQGPSGGNTATIFLYKRSNSTISTVGINSTLYYNFYTKELYINSNCTTLATTELNGWKLAIPYNNANPIYVTTAVVYNTGSVAEVNSNDWATPAKMAENGANGANGNDGEDGVSVIVTPASIIVEQSYDNVNNIEASSTNNLGQFTIQVKKGSNSRTITSITASTNQVYVSQSSSTGCYSGVECLTWSPDSSVANMYIKGIGKSGSDYYSTGEIALSITYADPDISNRKTISNVIIKVYVNLVGTWSESVKGDIKTELAQSSLFKINPQTGDIVEEENWGKYIRSSTENIQELLQVTYDYILDITAPANSDNIDGMTLSVEAGTYRVQGDFDLSEIPSGGAYLTLVGPGVNETWNLISSDEASIDDQVTFTSAGTVTISAGDDLDTGVAYDISRFAICKSEDKISKLELTADGIQLEVINVDSKIPAINKVPLLNWTDNSFHELTPNVKMERVGSASVMYSPQIYLTAGTYTFSGFFGNSSGIVETRSTTSGVPSVTIYPVTTGTETYQSKTRKYFTFTLSSSVFVRVGTTISGSTDTLYRPQLEEGNKMTRYTPAGDNIGTTGYVDIKSNEVNLGVRNDLGEVGINISGSNKTVAVKGGKFVMQDDAGNNTFELDTDGNLISKGSASFGGTIRAQNFFNNVSVFVEGGDMSYYKYYCTTDHSPYNAGGYYDTYDDISYFTKCSYDADTVVMNPDGHHWASSYSLQTLYLPKAEDFEGKRVDVYINYFSGTTGAPSISSVINNACMINGLNFSVNSSGEIVMQGGNGSSSYQIAVGETHVTCIAVKTTDSVAPYKWLVVGHTV